MHHSCFFFLTLFSLTFFTGCFLLITFFFVLLKSEFVSVQNLFRFGISCSRFQSRHSFFFYSTVWYYYVRDWIRKENPTKKSNKIDKINGCVIRLQKSFAVINRSDDWKCLLCCILTAFNWRNAEVRKPFHLRASIRSFSLNCNRSSRLCSCVWISQKTYETWAVYF